MYFNKFDTDGNNKITYDEFRMIMEEFMRNEMSNADELVSILRKEFKKCDIRNVRCLTKV